MHVARLSHLTFGGVCIALLTTLIPVYGGLTASGQRPKAQRRNPPALPANASRPNRPRSAALTPGAGAGPSSSLGSSSWTAIGPASLQSGAGLVSGRVTGIAVDPTDSNTIYAVAAGGGVWKTTDGGTTWNPLTDRQPTLSMGAIAVAATDHLRIYAATGEANNSLDSNYGLGILVSSDGGATWTLENAGGALSGMVIGQIAVDPTNENVAYAAVGGYGANGVWFANTGIWKTTDGGATWTNMTAAASLDSQYPWSAVVVDPNTPTTIYAALGDISDSDADNGVYESTDSGTTWTLLANGPNGASDTNVGRIALGVAPNAKTAGEHVLYVAVADVTTGGLHYFGRSDNADAATPTFTDLTSGTPDFLGGENSGGGQGWYDIVVNVDGSGNVYCAGVENYNTGNTGNVIVSTDLGVDWTDITAVGGVQPHTDSHAIAFDSSRRMLLGSDGGVFRYDPTANAWTILNSNLNTIQFQGIGLHPTAAGTVVGGSQDNGTELYLDNLVWSQVDGGDGGFAEIAQTDGSRCYAVHPLASFGPTDFFRRSDDGCSTWTSIASGIAANSANFYPPFLVDPANKDHVLIGGDYLNETTDGGNTWSVAGTPGTNGFNDNDADIDSIALSPANGKNPPVVYAAVGGSFATSSQIFVAENDNPAGSANTTWTEADLPTCAQNSYAGVGCRVNMIVADPNDLTGHTAIAVTSNFSTSASSHVFRTTDAGTIWTDITGNLPNLPTWSVKVDTDPAQTMYVGTDDGVYAAPSPYTSWTQLGTSLPGAQVFDLELNRSLHLLGVATHGRGAWEIFTPPYVTNVSTTAANGTYVPGAGIPIVLTFSAPVTVTGTPQLTLNTSPNAKASYTSGSGTNALTFLYTVGAGQTTSGNSTGGKLDYASGGALSLQGGTIEDGSDTAAELVLYAPGAADSLSANNDIVIAAKGTPAVTVKPEAASVTTAQSLGVTVMVGDGSNNPTPTGSVTLTGGGYTSAATPLSAGSATITIPAETLAAGSDSFSATYTPDTASASAYNRATGTAASPVTVSKVTPSIAVTSSSNPSIVSQSVTFTATLTTPVGSPSGSVSFFDGTAPIGSGNVTAGVATCTTTTLAAGTHSITAQYSGDANFAPIASGALAQIVSMFSIGPAPGAPSSATAAPGSIASYLLSVTPPASGTVTLSASGLPSGYNISFSPNTVAGGGGATQVEMIVDIPAQTASAPAPAKPGTFSRLPVAFGLLLLPLLGLRRLRNRGLLPMAVLAIVGVVASAGLAGCSHFNNGATMSGGTATPPGNYTLTVTATDGTETVSTMLTLNVN
ncbi:MAG TPA: Ig-like domain repeat protein [Terracidiphilus sp.]|nr:Ig-like domain repeat protein [Terracidiphilus sp.]